MELGNEKFDKTGDMKPFASVTAAGTKPITSFGVNHSRRECSGAKASQITELIADWLTENMRPLSVIGDSGFKRLLQFLEPGFVVPSRTHLTSLIKARYGKAKAELRDVFKREAKTVAITSDAWTSKAVQSYQTYTGHFINREWQLLTFVLSTARFGGSHTGKRIAEQISGAVEESKAQDKVVCVVQDEAANAVAAGRLLKEEQKWDSLTCSAHRLQTCIRHSIGASTQVQRLLAACRRVVSHFNHSSKETERLAEEQHRKPVLKVIQDCSTRWNSTFYMIERLLKLKVPLIAVLDSDENRSLLLKDHQWALASEVVCVLHPFERSTVVLSGQEYPTLSLVLPVISGLCKALNEPPAAAASNTIKSFRQHLSRELQQKFEALPTSTSAVGCCSGPEILQPFISER